MESRWLYEAMVDMTDMTGSNAYPPIWLNPAENHLNLTSLENGIYIVMQPFQ